MAPSIVRPPCALKLSLLLSQPMFVFQMFSQAAANLDITGEGGALVTVREGGGGAATTAPLITNGKHYLEFTLVKGDHAMIGVAVAGANPTATSAEGDAIMLTTTAGGWGLSTSKGLIFHNTPEWHAGVSRTPGPTWPRSFGEQQDCPSGFMRKAFWKGMPQGEQGDVLGLLFDSEFGMFTYFRNGQMMGKTMRHDGPLGEKLCWLVELQRPGDSIRIEAPIPPSDPEALVARNKLVFARYAEKEPTMAHVKGPFAKGSIDQQYASKRSTQRSVRMVAWSIGTFSLLVACYENYIRGNTELFQFCLFITLVTFSGGALICIQACDLFAVEWGVALQSRRSPDARGLRERGWGGGTAIYGRGARSRGKEETVLS